MMSWFSASKRQQGWLVVELDERAASYVHGRAGPSGKSAITLYGSQAVGGAADARIGKLSLGIRCVVSRVRRHEPGDGGVL